MADDRNARTERQRRNSRVATVDADDRSGQCAPALAFRVGASPFLGPRALMTVAHQAMANAIRALAMDAVQAANSGHPGMPMGMRSEEHTSELQSLMRISYAVFCLKKKKNKMSKTLQQKE